MEEKKTKTNRLIRNGLRILAYGVVVLVAVFRIGLPIVKSEPIYLDTNDGWVIGGSIALLLSIEAVKRVVDSWAIKKIG